MSAYTESVSRPGQRALAGDPRALFLTKFGGLVILSYEENFDYANMSWRKELLGAKAESFPIIGRKRDAAEHEEGEEILGGKISGDDVTIVQDKVLFDSVFIAEIDELLSHFDFAGPYASQIGQSIASLNSRRIAIMHILASRKFYVGANPVGVPQGQPLPTYFFKADMKTSASSLEDVHWQAKEYLLTNEISGEKPVSKLPFQQVLLLARNFGIATDNTAANPQSGSGSRVTAQLGQVVGFNVEGSNHIPKANITQGNPKYQGDFTKTVGHIGTKMAVGTLRSRGMRMNMVEQQNRLGTLLIGSMLEGHGVLRPECSIELATAART